MHLPLKFLTLNFPTILPINYQYPLSAIIYRILQHAGNEYPHFPHEKGYRQFDHSLKPFKLFTFSDIHAPFEIEGDRMRLLGREAKVIASFYRSRAYEISTKGQGQLGTIHIDWINGCSRTGDSVASLSTTVCGLKNEKGNYDFLSPQGAAFLSQLTYN